MGFRRRYPRSDRRIARNGFLVFGFLAVVLASYLGSRDATYTVVAGLESSGHVMDRAWEGERVTPPPQQPPCRPIAPPVKVIEPKEDLVPEPLPKDPYYQREWEEEEF